MNNIIAIAVFSLITTLVFGQKTMTKEKIVEDFASQVKFMPTSNFSVELVTSAYSNKEERTLDYKSKGFLEMGTENYARYNAEDQHYYQNNDVAILIDSVLKKIYLTDKKDFSNLTTFNFNLKDTSNFSMTKEIENGKIRFVIEELRQVSLTQKTILEFDAKSNLIAKLIFEFWPQKNQFELDSSNDNIQSSIEIVYSNWNLKCNCNSNISKAIDLVVVSEKKETFLTDNYKEFSLINLLTNQKSTRK